MNHEIGEHCGMDYGIHNPENYCEFCWADYESRRDAHLETVAEERAERALDDKLNRWLDNNC